MYFTNNYCDAMRNIMHMSSRNYSNLMNSIDNYKKQKFTDNVKSMKAILDIMISKKITVNLITDKLTTNK